MSTKRMPAVAVRSLTAEEVAKVMRRHGVLWMTERGGTAEAVASALNDILATKGDPTPVRPS